MRERVAQRLIARFRRTSLRIPGDPKRIRKAPWQKSRKSPPARHHLPSDSGRCHDLGSAGAHFQSQRCARPDGAHPLHALPQDGAWRVRRRWAVNVDEKFISTAISSGGLTIFLEFGGAGHPPFRCVFVTGQTFGSTCSSAHNRRRSADADLLPLICLCDHPGAGRPTSFTPA